MRLWSLHPGYLDAKGIVAGWREALLAQKVLAGATNGYRNHPQLERFRRTPHPQEAMSAFLRPLVLDARRRGYRFDQEKILPGPLTAAELDVPEPGSTLDSGGVAGAAAGRVPDAEHLREVPENVSLAQDLPHLETETASAVPTIPVTVGQVRYEAGLLVFKLRMRAPRLVEVLEQDLRADRIALHPLFVPVPGDIEPWEKVRNEI